MTARKAAAVAIEIKARTTCAHTAARPGERIILRPGWEARCTRTRV